MNMKSRVYPDQQRTDSFLDAGATCTRDRRRAATRVGKKKSKVVFKTYSSLFENIAEWLKGAPESI
jgi:hypothetical protein